MNSNLNEAIGHMEKAMAYLIAAKIFLPPLALLVLEPIIAVLIPLLERMRNLEAAMTGSSKKSS